MQWRPIYPITTPRLRLRPLTLDDTEALLAYRGDADVCRYLPFEPMDRDVLANRLAGDLGREQITAEGEGLTFGVELAADRWADSGGGRNSACLRAYSGRS